MKKVMLIGDEIRLAYQERVKELLSDICEVVYVRNNSGYTASALWFVREQVENVFKWEDIALIHWNTGIWDHHRTLDDGLPLVSAEEYLRWNGRFHRQLALYADRLIWATTTPAGEGYRYDPDGIYGIPKDEWNEEVKLYNDMAAAYLANQGVVINDLYAFVSEHPEYLGEDGINLSPVGVEAVAQKVAGEIRALLNAEVAPKMEENGVKKDKTEEECRFKW